MIILGTNSIKDTGYNVANSCRFNRGDSPSLVKDQSASPTHDDKGTLSFWFKIANLSSGDGHYFFSVFTDSNNRMQMLLQSDGTLKLLQKTGGSTVINLVTNRVFRDVSAWYHLVLACDSSQGTAANRIKIYINGVQESSFSTETYCNQDVDIQLVKGTEVCLGAYNKASPSDFFDGYLAEMVLIDGTQNAVTDFGEFDEDSPTIWKPKDVSGLTFGTNGFYLDFEDSANLGNDANGGTDFTENNLAAADQATDTCTNNFATINPLYYSASSYTLTNGNLAVDGNASNAWRSLYGTFGLTSGKWYWEIKIDAYNSGDANNFAIGVVSSDQVDQTSSNGKFFGTAQGYAYHGKDGKKLNNDTVTANGASYGDSYTTGDIVGVFLDLDNHKLYFSKNGTVQASGDPTSGSTGTNAAFSITTGHTYFPAIANYYSAEHYSFNYGSPPFSISSGNTDSNSYGNFEYPTQGYYACNTKNLAEFG